MHFKQEHGQRGIQRPLNAFVYTTNKEIFKDETMLMIIIGQDNNKIPNYMYGQLIETDEIGIETMALQSQKDKKTLCWHHF
jgi:hypothetical protein